MYAFRNSCRPWTVACKLQFEHGRAKVSKRNEMNIARLEAALGSQTVQRRHVFRINVFRLGRTVPHRPLLNKLWMVAEPLGLRPDGRQGKKMAMRMQQWYNLAVQVAVAQLADPNSAIPRFQFAGPLRSREAAIPIRGIRGPYSRPRGIRGQAFRGTAGSRPGGFAGQQQFVEHPAAPKHIRGRLLGDLCYPSTII